MATTSPNLEPRRQTGRALFESPTATTTTATPTKPLLDTIPPLTLTILTTRPDKTAALHLVADSIAQQRQLAARHLARHPLLLALLALALAIVYRLTWTARTEKDLGLALSIACGVVMTYLLAIRYVTAPFLRRAEDLITWEWLVPSSEAGMEKERGRRRGEEAEGEEDIVIGAKFGHDMIGALVLRLEPLPPSSSSSSPTSATSNNPSPPSSPRKKKSNSIPCHGVIRAWTTKLRYRHKGVGGDLLAEAVRVARERCGRDAEVGFAAEHANASGGVLPGYFDGVFRERERRAAKKLAEVLEEWQGVRRRGSGGKRRGGRA